MPLTATFEAGVNGNTITTGAGEASANAWDSVSIGGSQGLAYDNAHAAHGTLSAKVTQSGSGALSRAGWSTQLGTVTEHYGRVYLYFTAYPATEYRVFSGFLSAVEQLNFFFLAAGTIRVSDAGGVAITTTAAFSLNQWVRVEWHVIHSATVGQEEIKLFNSPDSSTPTETKTSSANRNNGTGIDTLWLGNNGGSMAGSFWMDDIVANAASYPGPAVETSTVIGDSSSISAMLSMFEEW